MDNNLESLRWKLRQDTVDIIMAGGGGHIGGDMSVVDILITLYGKVMNMSADRTDDPDRDRFLLSKGHAMEAYYAVLATLTYDSGDVIYVSALTRLASLNDVLNLIESVSLG